jgi:uncharacterized protein (TIGR00369 family)
MTAHKREIIRRSGPLSMQDSVSGLSRPPAPPVALDRDQVAAYLVEEFPQIHFGRRFKIEAVEPMMARVRMVYHPSQLRPGGTISGPSIFTLVDLSLYVAILGQIGRMKLAVTTNVNINFLSKPAPRDLLGEARLIKLGKRLAVGEVRIWSDGEEALVAHATGTYSIPPRGEGDAVL